MLRYYVVEYSTDKVHWILLSETEGLSVLISNLVPGAEYLFRVRGENGATENQDLNLVRVNYVVHNSTIPGPTNPAAPTTFAARSITTTTATLSWTAPTDNGGSAITDYVIETSRDGTTWSAVPHTASTSTSMNLSGLAPGTTYQVRIATKTAVGTSETLTGSFTTTAGAPLAPQNLAATSVTGTTLTLTWNLPTSNGGSPITDYKIEVSSNGGSSWSAITHSASNSRAFNVTGLAKGTSYRFRVSTITTIGTSAAPAVLSVTTVGNAPASPTTLKVTATTTTTVTLSWSQAAVVNGSAVRNYIVEYSTNSGGTWTVVTKSVSTSKSLTISGFRTKSTYRFRVKSVNDVGVSGYSNAVTVTTR
jgi:titin